MAATVHQSPQSAIEHDEGYLHYLARESRIALRWTMIICIIAIVALMVSPGFFFVAVIPAALLLVTYVLLLLANIVERRSDREAHAVLERIETAPEMADVVEDHAEDDQLHPTHAEIVKREAKVGLAIIGVALLVGLGAAAAVLPIRALVIGSFVFVAYVMFIALPVLLGLFNDDVEMESHRLNDEPQSAQARTTSD